MSSSSIRCSSQVATLANGLLTFSFWLIHAALFVMSKCPDAMKCESVLSKVCKLEIPSI